MHRKPGTVIEETLRRRLLRDHFSRNRYGLLLDLGCGTRPYLPLYAPSCDRHLGADMPGTDFEKTGVDIECTVYRIPLDAHSVDAVLLAEVLHDIAEPDRMFAELKRILKPGATLIMTSPFMVPVCDGAYDHYRYTVNGLAALLERNGFLADRIDAVAGLAGATLQFAFRPFLRIWNRIARRLHMPWLYTMANPFLLVFVFVPQWIYLLCHGVSQHTGVLAGLRRKMEYGCIGYVTIAHTA